MGLFEKQIPKYVRTPEEEVVVEPVVVDDIFDPLFNAEVKARLAQDYGNSPFATFAGYNELLNNIWTENDGTFGKGMGLLSAFGRSMEKADDLILGAATEAVEGISGQGFDNPIENIFVNDEDYTGRRFLAAAANTMRGFADGATVTEEDFNGAWGLPSLGIELMSDVGILGGGLARGLAPELTEQAGKRVPSSEIFRNLGKSGNATTTIGEVGQLLSDYDDLMTRAAIDITAPGLRPAFKALLPRIKQFVGVTDAEDFVDVYMNHPRVDVNGAEVPPPDGAFELYKNAYAKMMEIPETPEEEIARMSRTVDEIADDALANAEENAFNEMVEEIIERESENATVHASTSLTPKVTFSRRKTSKQMRKKLKEAYEYVHATDPDSFTPIYHTGYREIDVPVYVTMYKKYKESDKWFVLPSGQDVPKKMPHKTVTLGTSKKRVPVYQEIAPTVIPFSEHERKVLRTLYPNDAVYALEKERLMEWLSTQKLNRETQEAIIDKFEDSWHNGVPQSLMADLKAYLPETSSRHVVHPREKFQKRISSSFTTAQESIKKFTKREGDAISEVVRRSAEKGFPIRQLGVDTHAEDSVAERFDKLFRQDIDLTTVKNGQAMQKVFARTSPDFDNLTPSQKTFVDEIRKTILHGLGLDFEAPTISPWGPRDEELKTALQINTPHAGIGWWTTAVGNYNRPAHASAGWWRRNHGEFSGVAIPSAFEDSAQFPGVDFRSLPNSTPFKASKDWPNRSTTYSQSPSYLKIDTRDLDDRGVAAEVTGLSLLPSEILTRLGNFTTAVEPKWLPTFNPNGTQPSLNPIWDRSNGTITQYPWIPTSKRPHQPELNLNPTYLGDVLEKLSDDAALANAIHTGEWSSNAAVNASMNAFLNDPKRRDDLFYRASSSKWFISPSERAVLHDPKVRSAIFYAQAAVDDLRYVLGNGRETLYDKTTFDDFWNSDEMNAVLRDAMSEQSYISTGTYDVASGHSTVAQQATHRSPNGNRVPIDAKVSKIKRLIKQVMFPKFDDKYTPQKLYSDIEELVTYFDDNVDTTRLSKNLMSAYPELASYLISMDRVLDDIGTNFIAPVKGLGVASRDVRVASNFRDFDFVENFDPNYTYAIKQIMAQLGQRDVPYKDLKYIIEPLRDFVQFGFKHGGMDFTGTYPAKIVDNFYGEVLPLVEKAMAEGISLRIKKGKTLPYRGIFTKKDAARLTQFLEVYPYKKLLDYVELNFDNAFAPTSDFLKEAPKGSTHEQLLEYILSHDDERVQKWGFKPARDVPTPMPDYETVVTQSRTKVPATYKKEINLDGLTEEGVKAWESYLQKFNGNADAALEAFVEEASKSDALDALKWRENGFKGVRPILHPDWRKFDYDVASGDFRVHEWAPLTKPTSEVLEPERIVLDAPRTERIKYADHLPLRKLPFLKPTTPTDFLEKSKEFLRHVWTQESDVLRGNPNLTGNAVEEYYDLFKRLRSVQDAYRLSDDELATLLSKTDDLTEFKKLTVNDQRALYAYTSEYIKGIKNLPYHAIDLRTLDYATRPKGFVEDMIANSGSNKKSLLKEAYGKPLTPALEELVRTELIAKLAPEHKKFAKYWKPEKTAFDFDLPASGNLEYVRIGENIPLHPEYLQVFKRYGTGTSQTLTRALREPYIPYKGSGEKGYYLGALDYSKLYLDDAMGVPAAQTLTEVAARADTGMTYFNESPIENLPSSSAIYNSFKSKKRYRTSRVGVESPSQIVEQTVDIIEDQPIEELVTQFVEPATTSLIEAAQRNLVDEICPTISKLLSEGVPIDLVKNSLKRHGEWRWFEQIAQASTVRSRNATGDYATLREKRAEDIARRFVELEETLPYAESRKYYILKEKEMGDILTGSDFWNEFISTGMFAASFPKGSEHIENLRKAMQHNADVINTALKGDYVEVVVHNIKAREPNSVCVTMRWKPGKYDLIKRVVNNKQALDSAKFVDLVFSPPEALTSYEKEFLNKPTIKKLIDLEHEALSLIREHYARLGFTFDPAKEYTRHALNRRDDQGALQFFLKENFYGQISSETLDDISDNLATVYSTRRAFGSRAVGRRFRGRYWDTERQVLPLFSYSPLGRFKSAIASGALANSQYQAFTDFFVNDNFKIKGIFNSVDDLKKVLYATDEKGRLGNFTNAELVTFKVDATGRVIGLTKFDKTTDKGLQSALNDPNTILVPASVITSLDKMFRRETQMSNKFWVFINKYLTLPFKLGVLTNPGFLLGNISDATMKMATTMSRKYGTTFQQEAENTAKSISEVIALKNSYYDAFDEFLAAVAEVDAKLDPKQRIPDIVAMDPKSQKTFLKWLNDGYEVKNALGIVETVPCYLTSQQREAACFWLTLQTLQMNSSKLREFEEVAGAAHVSPYAMPTNLVERFIEGSGKYDPKNFRTWGFFMNNPIASGMLNASEGIEDVVRTASIVDDLRHKRYDPKRVTDILSKGSDEQITQLLVDIEGARNAMYSSQFDYERLTDFLDGVGTVVPFPIFFLKNFAYWMELFMENPQFVDNVVDVQEGLWAHRQEEDENDEFAKAAKGRGAVPIGGDLTGWFKGIYKPSPLQSMFGAFSLLNDPMSDLTYRVHPAISGVVAKAHEQMPTDLTTLLGGSDERSYRPYSTDIYEKNVKESDPNFDPMQYTMHRANPYERATQTYLRTPAKIANGEAQLSDFLPSIFQPDY